MQITDVRVRKVAKEGKLKAVVRSIQEQENEFSQQFLQDISRHLKKSRSR